MHSKIKTLAPTLREKQRYIVYKTIFPAGKPHSNPAQDVLKHINSSLGVLGAAEAGIQHVSFESDTGILRVAHTKVDETKAMMLLYRGQNGTPVILKTEGVSGTITKARSKFTGR